MDITQTVIIVSGAPASGKSSISHQLSEELKVPWMSKDRIKESLFDSLGYSDREWSRVLGKVSMELLFAWAEREISAGRSCILDSNFIKKWDQPKFEDLRTELGVTLINVHCIAPVEVLIERFEKRAHSGTRYPGHCDSQNLSEFKEILSRDWAPIFDGINVLTYGSDDSPVQFAEALKYRLGKVSE